MTHLNEQHAIHLKFEHKWMTEISSQCVSVLSESASHPFILLLKRVWSSVQGKIFQVKPQRLLGLLSSLHFQCSWFCSETYYKIHIIQMNLLSRLLVNMLRASSWPVLAAALCPHLYSVFISVATRYKAVIEACSLQPDIDILPQGDQTEIGERVGIPVKCTIFFEFLVVFLFSTSGQSSHCGSLCSRIICHHYCAARIWCLCVWSWTDLVQPELCHVGFLHAPVMREINRDLFCYSRGASATRIYGCNRVIRSKTL